MKKLLFFTSVVLLLIISLSNCVYSQNYGGTLKVGLDIEPPTLDTHFNHLVLTYTIGTHMLEGLYTLDEALKPIPMLASDYPEISEDKLNYRIKLRPGVTFHNGKELTADDAIASIKRWGQIGTYGKPIYNNISSIEKEDDLTFVIKLKEAMGDLVTSLAVLHGHASIMPKEICEQYPNSPVERVIGTGPFEFVEWKPHTHIKVKKFDNYLPVDFPANGWGGQKIAYVDEVYFIPLVDESVRTSSIESGAVDFADLVPVDQYERLKQNPNLQLYPSNPRAWNAIVCNYQAGIMSNQKIRQALLAAVDVEKIMSIGVGDQIFWRSDPGIFQKEQIWWSDAGKEKYNQKNIEEAKRLLKEAGYNGEKIKWMVCPLDYNWTLAAKNVFEEAGFNFDLQNMEWATVSARRENPELWDLMSTKNTIKPDPTMCIFINAWINGIPEMESVRDKLILATDFEKRYGLLEEMQELFYEYVPSLKLGDERALRVASKRVKGHVPLPEVFFWNVWLED